MFSHKNRIVIAITTFNTEMLNISVPAIAKLGRKFLLVIHNDNPNARVRRRDIRKMGYGGRLRIINSDANIGLWRARLRILDTIPRKYHWIIFVNDDDVLTRATIAPARENDFAIIQNGMMIIRRISDMMRASRHPDEIVADGQNIVIMRPHVGIAGTPVRINVMRGAARVIRAAGDAIDKIGNDLEFRPPIDAMMWYAVCEYAHMAHPNMHPIFMNQTNYIINRIDTDAEKYGRRGVTQSRATRFTERAMERYCGAINDAIEIIRRQDCTTTPASV